ncbi:phage integrase SAM-like domain-containing protein [Chondrinema litorale]|uniref:phage integrase SAM-like domain-containing protein n=1 Tax=Chondrinema litorale TaxID=2994555 RepID=UPI002542F8DA|nr:phage integrase SAM-like domain-containing protein [Chondrinema litorale]UZR93125.1 phage integrase SAM-like domain-containing protein [Chondrinema litorale]
MIHNEKKLSYSVQFYPRKCANKGYGTIYCHISIDRKRTTTPFSTNIRVLLKNWDNNEQTLKKNTQNEEAIELSKIKSKIYEIFLNYSNREEEITADSLKYLYLTEDKKKYTLCEVYELWMTYMESLIDLEIKESTFESYQSKYSRLREFLAEVGKKGILIKNVDMNLAYQFENWLKQNSQINSKSYQARCLSTLKRVMKWAVSEDILKFNPLQYLKVEKGQPSSPEYLSMDELALFEKFRFKSPTLQKVADCFVFQCWTSMDYADIVSFNHLEHIQKVSGKNWIIKKRAKAPLKSTRQEMQIPIFPKARRILDKYNWKAPIWSEKRNSYMSSDKYRKYLKECAAIVGIDDINLVSKTGRRTFINMMSECGVPSDDITAMVGHNHTKTTQDFYLRFSTRRIQMNIEKVFGENYLAG